MIQNNQSVSDPRKESIANSQEILRLMTVLKVDMRTAIAAEVGKHVDSSMIQGVGKNEPHVHDEPNKSHNIP